MNFGIKERREHKRIDFKAVTLVFSSFEVAGTVDRRFSLIQFRVGAKDTSNMDPVRVKHQKTGRRTSRISLIIIWKGSRRGIDTR